MKPFVLAAALSLGTVAHAQMDTPAPAPLTLPPQLESSGSQPSASPGFVVYKEAGPLTIERLHKRAVSWFVGKPGFGINRITGVRDHVFDKLPLPDEKIDLNDAAFGVTEIQLIGIAKHAPPVVFILEDRSVTSPHRPAKGEPGAPAMESLDTYKTRPLSENEEEAIATMKANPARSLVTVGRSSGIATPIVEVVGAIRATV